MGEKTKNKGKNILEIILIIYLIFCVIASAYWVYRKYFAPKTETDNISNLGEITDTNGKRCVVQAVYYENTDNSGVELLEVKLSSYSDTESKSIVSFGVQIVGDFNKLQTTILSKITERGILAYPTKSYYCDSFISGDVGQVNANNGKLYFYEEADNFNYKAINSQFDDFGEILVEINNVNYKFCFGLETLKDEVLWSKMYHKSTLSEFVKYIYNTLKGQSVGHKTNSFRFDKMFKIKQEISGVYQDITLQDNIINYSYVDFTHYTTGAKTANDSLFKQIQYNTNFVSDSYLEQNLGLLDEHFSDKSIYYLNEEDCNFTFDLDNVAYTFDISTEAYNTLKNKNLNLCLIINETKISDRGVHIYSLKENSLLKKLGVTKYYINRGGTLTGVNV